MTRQKPTAQCEDFITPAEAQRVLSILCRKFGFCLPPLWLARLRTNPPRSVSKFVDTVISVEGLNPEAIDRGMYEAMRAEVRLAFERSTSSVVLPQVSNQGPATGR